MATDETTGDKVRLVRLFASEKGIWHYEHYRDGIVRWSSLHTRDESEARRKYERLQRVFARDVQSESLRKRRLDVGCEILCRRVAEAFEPEWRHAIEDLYEAMRVLDDRNN